MQKTWVMTTYMAFDVHQLFLTCWQRTWVCMSIADPFANIMRTVHGLKAAYYICSLVISQPSKHCSWPLFTARSQDFSPKQEECNFQVASCSVPKHVNPVVSASSNEQLSLRQWQQHARRKGVAGIACGSTDFRQAPILDGSIYRGE